MRGAKHFQPEGEVHVEIAFNVVCVGDGPKQQIATAYVRECILMPEKTRMVREAIAAGTSQYGMQTFDQSVLALLREGLITEEDALKNCNNPNELSLKLKGIAGTSDRTWQPIEAAESAPETGAPAAGSSPSPGGSNGRRISFTREELIDLLSQAAKLG